jgi:Carbohydrate esterase, sialic acid-specific acetylesterase/PhoD-like phosphatase
MKPIFALSLTMLFAIAPVHSKTGPVRVFILAGQSNMEGQGFIYADPTRNGGQGSLEFLVKNAATADRFATLVDASGQWRTRDDVWISYLDRKGLLTVGYGARPERIGPELGFGWVMGDAFEEPVLLIKCAWGGKSLAVDFRPPSAGMPPYSLGEKEDAAIDANSAIIGKFYRETLTLTRTALANIKDLVPGSDGEYVLAGFGWHQGWNDRINDKFNSEYESNMTHFIKDMRKDLGTPKLPFVIAETGMTGPEETHPRALSLMKAQEAVAGHPEFQGNVAFVGTRGFRRPQEQSPTQQGYHWNSNAETYYLIGQSMGRAMQQLQVAKTVSSRVAVADRVSIRPDITVTTLGFGSCAKQNRPQPIWDSINAAQCDAFVLCGDNIYGDSPDPVVLREKYALLAAMPGFAKLRQTTPLFATWDNHDYGSDEIGAGWEGAAAAQRAFCDFFRYPADAPQRTSAGIYDCITLGPAGKRVQLILLDTKSFRSPLKESEEPGKGYVPNTNPGSTILGEAQWAWLGRRLREPAEIRVLISSNQFIPTEHRSQKWANFPADRRRFLELLQATRAEGLVIVSGDRHLAEISRLPATEVGLYPLFEMTTSALNQPGTNTMSRQSEANRYRTHENTYIGSNFGILRFNWDATPPSLQFEIRDLGGNPVITQSIPFPTIIPHQTSFRK